MKQRISRPLFVALVPIAMLLVGCASLGLHSVPKEAAGENSAQRLTRELSAADHAQRSGRYEEAATLYEELASKAPNSSLETRAWSLAARCRLAIGDSEGFLRAIDRLWSSTSPMTRARLGRSDMALIALADRLEKREPRVPVRALPLEIQSLIEAPAVATWVLSSPRLGAPNQRSKR